MNNIIVRETSSEIRAIARNALRGSWPMGVVGYFVYYVMTSTIPALLAMLLPSASMYYYNEILEQNIALSYVANLYTTILIGAFTLGLCSFMLAFFRKKDINPGYIFNGFEYFIKAFGLMIVVGFFTFLWSLLFLVPGIIAAVRYSQAFYVLADHPEKGIMECMNETKYLMNGNKSKFFCLCLSFIGWLILAAIPGTFIPYTFFNSGIMGIILTVIFDIPNMFVMAYLYTARTAFYDLVTGNLVAKPQFSEDNYNF